MIGAILVILFAHFVGDFVVQPDKVATNKWRSNKALTIHVALYTLTLFAFVWMLIIPTADFSTWCWYLYWAVFNGVCHWITDYVISKDRKTYWDEKDYRMYFIMVGFDQTAHYAVLAITYSILTNFII